MRVLVVGAGYVGLTAGTCLASLGCEVVCCDTDRDRIERLGRREVPIFEPGLAEMLAGVGAARLAFTAELPADLGGAEAVLVCVGTPPREDGTADLSSLWGVAGELAPRLRPGQLVLTKCTVPPGTNRDLAAALNRGAARARVVAVPEFLREGSAVHDFLYPDRVVLGAGSPADAEAADRVFAGIVAPRVVTSWEGAELVKYAANAYLAVRLSFVNELARVCAGYGADVLDVARGMGADHRIGLAYLTPGMGFGGSCLPKDIAAFRHAARAVGRELAVVEAAERANAAQLDYLTGLLEEALGGLAGRRVAVWGLAFKAGTDDVRDSPAVRLVDRLLLAGAEVCAHDPAALENARRYYAGAGAPPGVTPAPEFADDLWQAARDADAVVVAAAWEAYVGADLARLRACLQGPVVLDARNCLDPEAVVRAGLRYLGVGRGAPGGE